MMSVLKSGFLALLVAVAVGCGVPSRLDNCHLECDANKKCGATTDAQAANCHTTCDANKGSFADQDANDDRQCKNGGTVRSEVNGCLGKECNKIQTCLAAIDTTCVQK
jgi:hypothetical protein